MQSTNRSFRSMSPEEKRSEFIHFLKQCLRDLQPLNREAVEVCALIERALDHPGEIEWVGRIEISAAQGKLLVDIVHHLENLMRAIAAPSDSNLVYETGQRLRALVSGFQRSLLSAGGMPVSVSGTDVDMAPIHRQVRHHDEEFRLNAVKRVLDDSVKISHVAKQIGVTPTTLAKWKKDFLYAEALRKLNGGADQSVGEAGVETEVSR